GGSMASGKRKVLVAVADEKYRFQVGKAVEDVKAEPVLVASGREVLRRLTRASDIDAVVLDSTLTDPTLPYLLAQIKADARTNRVPVLLAAVPDNIEARDLMRRYRDASLHLADINVRA